MQVSVAQFILFLSLSIGLIFLLSIKFKVPAFFSLILASILAGFGLGIPATDIINLMKDGFGNIMKSLGFIIVLGTTLGIFMSYTGSSKVMAEFILRVVGEKNAALGLGITGLIIGLPVFCDSGYIVLNGLNLTVSRKSRTPLIITSVSLATGLLSVHCLIPPHPGAAAAAAALGVDFGKLMFAGIGIAIAAMLSGYFWARWAGKNFPDIAADEETKSENSGHDPSVFRSFLPVLIPIFLIALKSFLSIDPATGNYGLKMISFFGEPVVALSVGIFFAFINGNYKNKMQISELLTESIEKAGGILVIIGAGGAFGSVLSAGKIGEHVSHIFPIASMGLLFPFILTLIIKTAQGSSTVAIITASSIILPLLSALGLDSENGRLLCVLSMGAGSMIVSQANDAYFWVIARFSRLEVNAMLKVYTMATLIMGLVSFSFIFLLSLFLK